MNSVTPTILIVPGLREHVPNHWQTLLAAKLPKVLSVAPLETDKLSCTARVDAIERAMVKIDGPVIIVAHSAGAMMVAHWAATRIASKVRGALLAADGRTSTRLFADGGRRRANGELRWHAPVEPRAPEAHGTLERKGRQRGTGGRAQQPAARPWQARTRTQRAQHRQVDGAAPLEHVADRRRALAQSRHGSLWFEPRARPPRDQPGEQ